MNTIPDATALASWRKSTYSETNTGGCVEISDAHEAGVPIRDSKNPHGPAIIFATPTWSSFVAAVKQADFR